MSEQLIKVIYDCETGLTTEVPLTPEEIEELRAMQEESKAQAELESAEAQRIADLKASAKAKLVAGEPLTEEEAATLVI